MKPNDKAIEAGVKLCWDCPRATPSMIRDILTAAYAAQFPPSEDYAGLIARLKNLACELASVNDAIGERFVEINEAADALEVLLAERDALRKWKEKDSATMRIFARYRELEAEVAAWKGRQEATAALLKQIEAERDALLARLAPVDDEALVEIAAKAISKQVPDQGVQWGDIRDAAIDAIAAVRPHIEAAERKRCAAALEITSDEIRLHAGEMTAQEMRSVLSVLTWRAAAIRSGK